MWWLGLPLLWTDESTILAKRQGDGKGRDFSSLLMSFKSKKKKDYTSRLKSKAKPQLCNFERFLNLYWLILKTLNFKEITKNFS